MLIDLIAPSRSLQRQAGSLCDLVPWFSVVAPGVVLCLDGSLLAGFRLNGIDAESSDADVHSVSVGALALALRTLDDHCTVWTTFDKRYRVYTKGSEIPNPVARFIDTQWRDAIDNGRLAEMRSHVFVAYQPFLGAFSAIEEFAQRTNALGEPPWRAMWNVLRTRVVAEAGIAKYRDNLITHLESFEGKLTDMAALAQRIGLDRMGTPDLLSELSSRLNLATPSPPATFTKGDFEYLSSRMPLDTLHREANGLFRFEGAARSRFARTLSVKEFPGEIDNRGLEELMRIRGEFSIVNKFRFLDRERAKKLIQDAESHYRANVKSPFIQAMERLTGKTSERVNTGELILAEDAQDALAELTADGLSYGYHAMAVEVFGDTAEEVDALSQQAAGTMGNLGYPCVAETIAQLQVHFSMVPGSSIGLRETLKSVDNLATLTFVRSLRTGANENPHLTKKRGVHSEALSIFPTSLDVPEMLNLHVGDVGHFMVVGGTGGGKTTFVNFLLANWTRYSPCRVFVIDKKYSSYVLNRSLGGEYIDVSPDAPEKIALNPLRWMKNNDVARCARFLELLLVAYNGEDLSSEEAAMLNQALLSAADVRDEDGPGPRLAAVHSLLVPRSQTLANRLLPFLRGGSGRPEGQYGKLFDNEKDGLMGLLSNKREDLFCSIELGKLLDEPRIAPAVLFDLFNVIEEATRDGVPTIIYLEEAWYLLRNQLFLNRFDAWLRTMRSYNAVVGFATQSVNDVSESSISAVLRDNIPTRFFLANSSANASRDVYQEVLGLRPDEVDVIRQMMPKRQYYMSQQGRSRLLDAPFPPIVRAYLSGEASHVAAMRRHEASDAPDYLRNFVKEVLDER